MLSTALAKPQAIRGWGAGVGSKMDGGGVSGLRTAQTPAKGFNNSLQELNLSWNSIGILSLHD